MTVKVDEVKCVGCGACVDMCPVNALHVENGKVQVNNDCIDCGACTSSCPVDALEL